MTQTRREPVEPTWEGKSKGNKAGYRIFIGILRVAGVRPAYFLLRFVSFYYFLFSWSSSRPILNFYKKLGFGFWRRLSTLYRNYYLFGQTLIDKIVVMSGISGGIPMGKAPYTFMFDGEQHIEEIMSGGRGGILISAHMGNYELAAYYFKRLPVKVNVIMVDQEQAEIKDYLESVMNDRNLNIIHIKDDFSHIYEISNALRRNELVAIHGDRFVKGSKTIEGTLLGAQALFPIGPFVLATIFKVPVSYVFCFKDSAKHYHLYATPPAAYTANKQTAIPEALKDYITELEARIKMYPEQWFNYYDFFSNG
jgi:predicted LPLAT superfamily acyltransferase